MIAAPKHILLFVGSLLYCVSNICGQVQFPEKFKDTFIAKLRSGDSITIYQCHVDTADIQIKTNAQTINSKKQLLSITEKFVIVNNNNTYSLKYFTSGSTFFPNRKFSGLKIREKEYWQFSYKSTKVLEENELQFIAGLETSSKETTEYDFAITKHTTNQIIIKHRKDFSQLLTRNNLIISKCFKL